MALPQEDRIAFSLKIVSTDSEVQGLEAAKAGLSVEIAKAQKLDNANKNLLDPVNAMVNAYQLELAKITGSARTTFTEQDILDSGARKMKNFFFPNDTAVAVPSLTPSNIWGQVKPFALTYAIGKNYTEGYGSVQKEQDLISTCNSLINSASSSADIENTSGKTCSSTGSCSLPQYTTQGTCTDGGGIWTAGPDSIVDFPDVHDLKTNLVNTVNSLLEFLTSEAASIVTNDSDPVKQAQNDAALENIETVIKPALSAWLALTDFSPTPGSVTTCSAFYSYSPELLGPTKLHSTEIGVLSGALSSRLDFLATRVAQINVTLGNIAQNISNGSITSSSGLYGKRYDYLSLRLDGYGGSLTKLASMQTATGAQDSIKENALATKAMYQSVIPTSLLKANANGSEIVHLIDPSFVSVGDTVYVYAENQEELKRGVRAISGSMVTLSDAIPAKYRTSDKARLYKDES